MKPKDFPLERQFMDELGNLLHSIRGEIISVDGELRMVFGSNVVRLGEELISDSLGRNLDDPGTGIRDKFRQEVSDLFDLLIDFSVDLSALTGGRLALAFPGGYLETQTVLDMQNCRYLSGAFEEYYHPHKELPW